MEATLASSSPLSTKKRPMDAMEFSSPEQHDPSSTNPTTATTPSEPSPEKPKSENTSLNVATRPRQPSPAPSAGSSLSSLTATPSPFKINNHTTTTAPPSKKRKLTPSEREARQIEMVAKKAQREEEKARKLEEKSKKDEERATKKTQQDEERRQKNEMKEEKRREKELRDQQKEQKKRMEEEELQKKQRAQMRMTSFFAKPRSSPFQGEATDASISNAESSHVPRRRSQCQEDSHGMTQTAPTESKVASDYERTFLPFALPSNASLAPINRFTWDAAATRRAQERANQWFSEGSHHDVEIKGILDSLELAPWDKAPRGLHQPPTKDLVNALLESDDGDMNPTGLQPLNQLKSTPVKFICFCQDVRPPYVGTCSKFHTRQENRALGRNPFRRAQVELEYEYDSEAEWEEPDEGDEIDSEADSESESVGDAEEMNDFLDDEADSLSRPNKKLHSDMEPISSGVCWEDGNGCLACVSGSPSISTTRYRMEVFCNSHKIPLDPLSNASWASSTHTTAKTNASPPAVSTDATRQPLQALANPAMNGPSIMRPPGLVKQGKPKKEARLLTGEELANFKHEVDGSDLPKQGLLAVIKKRFPKIPNAVLGDTLSAVAKRMGAKEADKKWVIVS